VLSDRSELRARPKLFCFCPFTRSHTVSRLAQYFLYKLNNLSAKFLTLHSYQDSDFESVCNIAFGASCELK
jgi:hypothetical protein